MTNVKICGITNLKDATQAVELGADALGFNFFKNSSRYIPPTSAAEIIRQLPKSVKSVGIFVKESQKQLINIIDVSSISAVQLHGRESPGYVRELRDQINAEIILALPCNAQFVPLEIFGFERVSILLDSFSNGRFGGTGETFNWERAKLIPNIVSCLYLAGGLTPENVAEAVEKVRPHFVDVASGVESSPGKKDPKKVEAFIRNAKNA